MADPAPQIPSSTRRQMFDEWLRDHSDGSANVAATLELADVVKAVSSLRKKGHVTIEVRVAPIGGSGRQIATAIHVTSKMPQPDPEASIEYVGDGGSLHREDPHQGKLDLRDVSIPMVITDAIRDAPRTPYRDED
jgi:hypothetical protein